MGRKFSVRCGVARCAFGAQWSAARRCKFGNAQHGVAWRVWQRNGKARQNSTAQQSKIGLASMAKMGSACRRNRQSKNGAVFVGRSRQSENGAVFGRGTSLSRCSHFLTHLWAKFKGLFYPFYRSFISFYCKFHLFHRGCISYFRSFFSSFCNCFSFYHSFNSSFYLQKTFFRVFCLFEIFKCFIFGLLRPFCHFEPLQKGKKSTQIKRKLAIFGYFADAQYDKFGLLSKNDRQRKCTLLFHNESGFCHFERSDPTGCKAQSHKSALNRLLKLNFRLR